MKKPWNLFIGLLFLVPAILFAAEMDYSPGAVLWTQGSAEARALKRQAFHLASLRSITGTRPVYKTNPK